MSLVSTSEARENFSELVNLVAYGKERHILKRRGKDIVAMIPIEDLRRLEAFENSLDLTEAKAELVRSKGKGRPWKEIKEQLGL